MSNYSFKAKVICYAPCSKVPLKLNNVAFPRCPELPSSQSWYKVCILKIKLHSWPWPPSCSGLLFQGQVTRAQEAEENYVIKRELAVVRQQCNTASESLEKAQDTIRELQQQKVNTNPQSMHKHCGGNGNDCSNTEGDGRPNVIFPPIRWTRDLCRNIFSQGRSS